MKTVKATVVYPVEVEITVPEDTSPDDIWDKLIKTADNRIIQFDIAPVVHKCSEPITKVESIDAKEINTQEDWVQFILQRLQQAKTVLDPITSALTLLKPKAHPEIILTAHQNLSQAIEYLISSVSNVVEFPYEISPIKDDEQF